MPDSASPIAETVTRADHDCSATVGVRTTMGGAILVGSICATTLGWRGAIEGTSINDSALVALVGVQATAGIVFLGLIATLPRVARRRPAVGRVALISILIIGAAMRLATLPQHSRRSRAVTEGPERVARGWAASVDG